MTKQEGESPTGQRWRSASRFNQGEPYHGQTPGDAGRWRRLFLAGGAMIAVTLILSLLGMAPLWAVGVGVALFLGLLMFGGGAQRAGAAPTIAADDDALKRAGVDRADLEASLAAASADLAQMDAAAEGLSSQDHRHAVAGMTGTTREIIAKIAADPGDLRRARKFLKVFVPAARASVEKFLALGVVNDPALDAKFSNMLSEMTEASRRQRDALALDDKIDLEVEMEVLADRLTRES
ncbi:MAG: 5-bromo-4-chloroindolyl phosphate hydrolysis family protein [Rhodobacteraceae bacterium]|nr:5-bromo-4-chloroindolyl phosphate hydrolysis family protein [Paracoccaceae bacterium]